MKTEFVNSLAKTNIRRDKNKPATGPDKCGHNKY